MRALSAPSAEQALHWSRAVSLRDAAMGACLTATAGQSPRHLTSVIMVEAFLNPIDEVSYENLHDTVNYVNPRGLAAWVSNTIGDVALGESLAEIAADERAYGFQVRDIKPLLGARLKQYAQAISGTAVDSEESVA